MADKPPPPAWIDAGTAIAWIAFGAVLPTEDWTREARDWRAPRDLLLGALLAIAEGREDFPVEEPDDDFPAGPDDFVWDRPDLLDEVDRLKRETGLTAEALAAELRADVERFKQADARTADRAKPTVAAALEAAGEALRAAAEAGQVRAQGRLPDRPDDPRDAIPPRWFDEKRRISPFGDLEGPRGRIDWIDVRFDVADVLRVRPPAGEESQAEAPSAPTYRTGTATAEWLTDYLTAVMQAAPTAPRGKPEVHPEALVAAQAQGRHFSERMFDRAWTDAAKKADAPAWTRPGRRSNPARPPQEITAPNKTAAAISPQDHGKPGLKSLQGNRRTS
jgi:hypothetical protein